MDELTLRSATLDDAAAISALFRSKISVWQRMNADGRAEDVHYEALTLHERWLHGGAWMSLETSALLLNHLLLGAGMPIVAFRRGKLTGYAEAYINSEPDPYGVHLHVAHMITREEEDNETGDALLALIAERARKLRCDKVTYNRITDPALNTAAERRIAQGAECVHLSSVRRYTVPARTGQIFYKTTEFTNADPMQISGWAMPVGRTTSSRHLWETAWTSIFSTLTQSKPQRIDRLRVSSGGTDAYVLCQQDRYDPRAADICAWTPRLLTSQMVAALCDWSHRVGYRELRFVVGSESLKALGTEAEADAYTQDTYALKG
jgi:hypothetical protein